MPVPRSTRLYAGLTGALALFATLASGAVPEPSGVGPGGAPHRVHAIVDARLVPAPGEVVERGTIVIRDGLIDAMGADVRVPDGARVHPGEGLTVYAGLIEPYLRVELGDDDEDSPVHPERRAAARLTVDDVDADGLRSAGFTAALVVPADGVFRGTSALLSLGDGPIPPRLLRADVAQHVAFERTGSLDYPNSLMGAIALVRQTILDARHARAVRAAYDRDPRGRERPTLDRALTALLPVVERDHPIVVEVAHTVRAVRAAEILQELEVDPVLVIGRGDEARWIDDVRAAGCPIVTTLNFPPAPAWESEVDRALIGLDELLHWDRAPSTPARLHQAGVDFSVTTAGLSSRGTWRDRIRQAIDRGLPPDAALAAVTTTPARLLGVDDRMGTLVAGAIANLTVCDGDLFADDTEVLAVWVDGDRFEVAPGAPAAGDLAGTWRLRIPTDEIAVRITADHDTLTAHAVTATGDTLGLDDVSLRVGTLRATLPAGLVPGGSWRLIAAVGHDRLDGTLRAGDERIPVSATRDDASPDGATANDADVAEGAAGGTDGDEPDLDADESDAAVPGRDAPVSEGAPTYPPLPEARPSAVLIRGATVWTQGADGILAHTDVLVRNGRIDRIGADLDAPDDAVVVEGGGMHVTPGLIDTHSHAFTTGGINECSTTCTAEVRVADILNPETGALYAFLAGGTTAANILHGSCNPIGGQNAVVKARWGANLAGLLIDDAPPGIKFALGENVKRSGWSRQQTRYPATRLGVAETLRERFVAARAYVAERERGAQDGVPPRRDLQLEAVAEVLDGTRYVHCHAYRQDEMLMLNALSKEFGFTIRTFQHALEAYRIADVLAESGVGVSMFIDWWSSKHETREGIPYNAAICYEAGVLTSLHSDNSSIARRMNQEAAKAVSYGGVPETDALAMVTLNAARQLGIDHRVGSIEPGKDADLVIWDGHPLSPSTRVEETWLDGRRYFSRARDLAARTEMEALRERLLAAASAAEYTARDTRWTRTFGADAGKAHLEIGACIEHEEMSR